MRVLVLGGTGLLGRHVVDAAVEARMAPTLFDRGRTSPGAFPDLERVRGERRETRTLLGRRSFEAIIDLSGFDGAGVEAVTRTFADRGGHYVLVSSVSAYARLDRPGTDESAPLVAGGDDYRAGKAAAEQALARSWHGPSLVVRPGILTGPGDRSGRAAYWPLRLARGGDVLAPAAHHQPVQLLDARDLAGWLVAAVRDRVSGTLNAVGPDEPLNFERFITVAAESGSGDARIVWVDESFLLEHGVRPGALPLWTGREQRGLMQIDGRRALAAGLRPRRIDDTLRDVFEWSRAHAHEVESRGLDPRREAQLLEKFGPR